MMRKSFPSRHLFALAAIYVVVLQALLLPLAVAAGSPDSGSLCVSAGSDTQAPAQPDTGCACAAGCGTQCCAYSLSGAPRAALAYDPTFAWVLTPALTFEAVTQAAIRLPQNPRAPPIA
jgi:hypothetical protein